MPQLFKRRVNLFSTLILLALAGVAIGGFAFGTVQKWSDWQTDVNVRVEQPVPFSHEHHVSGLGLDCRYCHTTVTRSASAGMPPTHTCMTCHSQIWTQSEMLEPVRESMRRGKPIEWNRVTRLPHFVYFDHSAHVNHGVGCTSCHGEIKDMPLTRKVRTFYMRDCLACHREPEKALRPLDEVFATEWKAPPDQLERGARFVDEYHIPKARLTDCYTCHR
jgi:hypothetical protein